MTKVQKIWLGVFLAMFIVPEVLWSPVGNVIYSFFQSGQIVPQIFRDNFLLEYKFEYLLKFILTLQLISITSILFYTVKNRSKISNSVFWPAIFIVLICAIPTIFSFYLTLIFSLGI